MKKTTILFILLVLILNACDSIPGLAAPTATPTASATATATIPPPTETPLPTETATIEPTATPFPEPEPILGVAESNVTVRAEDRKGSPSLGGIYKNQGINIIARNISGRFFYIVWDESPTGRGWVLADAVILKDVDVTMMPIAIINPDKTVRFAAPLVWIIEGTPLPLPPTATGPDARVAAIVQTTNVRVAPNTFAMSMGSLQVGDMVNMTGRFGDNEWAQIEYPSGPNGKGWVIRESVKPVEGFSNLPFFDALGLPVTPAPTPDPSLPTATNTPPPAGPQGQATAQLNVRSGPAGTFDVIGLIDANSYVVVTGLTLSGYWYQIEYANGPDGRAWVAAEYVKPIGDFRKLPYYTNEGILINP